MTVQPPSTLRAIVSNKVFQSLAIIAALVGIATEGVNLYRQILAARTDYYKLEQARGEAAATSGSAYDPPGKGAPGNTPPAPPVTAKRYPFYEPRPEGR